MKLHLNKMLFKDAVRVTAGKLNLPPEFVEKDYWVTFSLYQIFKDAIGKETIFKGGTALSKCFNLIDRFSEDIDLVVMRSEGESDSKLKSKIKRISDLVSIRLPEIETIGITHKKGMIRKTAHVFERQFEEDFKQVRSVIVIESTWLSNHKPFDKKQIVSFVGEMMIDNNQIEIAKEFELLPFELLVLDPTRTICEKIMSLVRFSYGYEPISNLKNKVRHTYDLHKLLSHSKYLDFFQSKKFDEMILLVAKDDFIGFKNNNEWIVKHPQDALIFKELDRVWVEMSKSYVSEFRPLVYKDFPKESEILTTLKMIQKRLETINWSI